ncbi:hypothetical protein ACIBL3_05920 [Kribbella sp. NPDC050124]|uniref:hypothetical protein n=1 Tax=Kribbella sp. NPDC050124 TaxID=3364114 RepID=UPI0037B5E776
MQSRRRFLGLIPATAAALLSGCRSDSQGVHPSASVTPRTADERHRYGEHPNHTGRLDLANVVAFGASTDLLGTSIARSGSVTRPS